MAPVLTIENLAGEAITYQGNTLVPFAQVWRVHIPWPKGGLVWNRPISMVVRAADGRETVVPIQDVSRQVLWLLFGMSFSSAALAFLIHLSRQKRARLANRNDKTEIARKDG